MNSINEIVSNISEAVNVLRQNETNIASSLCIINGAPYDLEDIEKLGWGEFVRRSKISQPRKLYKYFPNRINCDEGYAVNYSIQALKNNTVYLASPLDFDDVYDSDININPGEYEKVRIEKYCKWCGVDVRENMTLQEKYTSLINRISDAYQNTGSVENALIQEFDAEIENVACLNFSLKLRLELVNGVNVETALHNVIRSDYADYTKSIKETFRVACFATTPYSQLMWGGMYADCHKGFCIEYTDDNNAIHEVIRQNLMPVVYCKCRPEMSERLARVQGCMYKEENIWDIYFHGVLRKSIDWAFQNEWRFILPRGMVQDNNYNYPFFTISKVFLGNRMGSGWRQEIIAICKEKGIPYVGVTKNPNQYEMEECKMLCENCPQYLSGLESTIKDR